jgi:hypothetical protein
VSPRTTLSFFPAKHARRVLALLNLARIFRATPRALGAILAPVSSAHFAVADAIATTAAVTIVAATIVAVADPTVAEAGPAVVAALGSNVAPVVVAAASIVITEGIPDRHAALNSFPRC